LIYAIGDIHGCYDQLLILLTKIKAHAGYKPYRAIFLGDYVDRGPKSREVVNEVRDHVTRRGGNGTWQALKGNHEDLMAQHLAGSDTMQTWLANGGVNTLSSYSGHTNEMTEHGEWLAALPTLIETENHIFVHAGLDPRSSISEQPDQVRLWIRNWEDQDHDFGKHVVYGHTPRKVPKLLGHSSGLDTGGFRYGTLTAGVFDSSKPSGPVELLQAG
jgi:serine/threonine protein phosphatase 1